MTCQSRVSYTLNRPKAVACCELHLWNDVGLHDILVQGGGRQVKPQEEEGDPVHHISHLPSCVALLGFA